MISKPMALLVSVQNREEALAALAQGVDLIDCKDPSQGALGGLTPKAIEAIVAAVREEQSHVIEGQVVPRARLTATVGDWPASALAAIDAAIDAVAATGVDDVKVGVLPGPGAAALIDRLTRRRARGDSIVPVLLTDAGIDTALLEQILAGGFDAMMVDVVRKAEGSIVQRVSEAALRSVVARARAAGMLVGISGALQAADLPALTRLAPDFAGFRSAVTGNHRESSLDPVHLAALVRQARAARSALAASALA